MTKNSLINIDDSLSDTACYIPICVVLETTKVLDRLYGRKIAQKFFTSHVKFDTINITV